MEIEESIARFANAASIITDREAVDLTLALGRCDRNYGNCF